MCIRDRQNAMYCTTVALVPFPPPPCLRRPKIPFFFVRLPAYPHPPIRLVSLVKAATRPRAYPRAKAPNTFASLPSPALAPVKQLVGSPSTGCFGFPLPSSSYPIHWPALYPPNVFWPEKPILKYPHQCPCLLYTSPSPRDLSTSRMPSSA